MAGGGETAGELNAETQSARRRGRGEGVEADDHEECYHISTVLVKDNFLGHADGETESQVARPLESNLSPWLLVALGSHRDLNRFD